MSDLFSLSGIDTDALLRVDTIPENGAFIVNARPDIKALLAEVDDYDLALTRIAELEGERDVLTDQVAGRDATIQRVRGEHPRAELLDENDTVCGYVCGGCLDIDGKQAVPWPCPTIIALDGDPADEGKS